jgi:3-phosphoshikimate 1-carboxyvinyltransferase
MTDQLETDGAIRRAARLSGKFRPPGDKSISHRALLLAGLARGESFVTGLNPGEDCATTRSIMTLLGSRFADDAEGVRVWGTGGKVLEPRQVLDCRNSGTTLRLTMGIAAAVPGLRLFSGDASLSSRPMGRVAEPLTQMGASIWLRDGQFPPLAVKGAALRPVRYTMPVASAQVKSAVLLAGMLSEGLTEVTETIRTRDHTERLLEHFGARVSRYGRSVAIQGPVGLEGRKVVVPGDVSAAAFLLTAALIVEGSSITARNVGVNPTRWGLMSILERMGAHFEVEKRPASPDAPEETADVTAFSSRLAGTTIEGVETALAIDELPILAVAAACAEGTTVIRDAAELRIKESDRISAVAAGLSRLGVRIEEKPDGWVIEGGGPGFRFQGVTVDSRNDHRVAMAFAVAGLRSTDAVRVLGFESVAISDPDFLGTLEGFRHA